MVILLLLAFWTGIYWKKGLLIHIQQLGYNLFEKNTYLNSKIAI